MDPVDAGPDVADGSPCRRKPRKAKAPKVSYYSLTPPFVGNYALDGGPKLQVYKADVALRVTGPEAAAAIKAIGVDS